MRLLASVVSVEEARDLAELGFDIIDLKNPAEGSLGAAPPELIEQVIDGLQGKVPISVAIGDLANCPIGTVALAVRGAVGHRIDYVKAGILDPGSEEQLRELLYRLHQVSRLGGSTAKFVAAGFGDYRRLGGLLPLDLLHAAADTGVSTVMLDTAIKDGTTLLDWMGSDELSEFISTAHGLGLEVALAGSLGLEEISLLAPLGVDIIGIRGAICSDSNRLAQLDLDRASALLTACHAVG